MIPEDIDFAAYERDTEFHAKVRRASVFIPELKRQFKPRETGSEFVPEMFSTKLRGLIEFRPAEVTVWAGYNGHKKSMFTGQLALDLCVQNQRVLIISLEMKPERTLGRMARQAAGKKVLSDDESQNFGEWTNDRLWMFDHMGRITPAKCVAVLRYFAQELQGGHAFVDSMMMVCASEEKTDEQKQFITDLINVAQETNLHIHLIAHCRKPPTGDDRPPTKYEIRGSAAISDQVDNIGLVYANKPKQRALQIDPNDVKHLADPDALIVIDKQRNGEFEGSVKQWWDSLSMRFLNDRITAVEPYAFFGGMNA